ncbi:MAG: PLP-dependent aspartate aminotransferase family protein [Chloroflexota bacterium]|nr:PLP-dependent aspartate aminotransferase family protein [Chloroflexota bacterium]
MDYLDGASSTTTPATSSGADGAGMGGHDAPRPRQLRRLRTAAVHAGERAPRPDFQPLATPIYHTATFLYDTAAELDGAFDADPGYVYARHGNPTVRALETALATLEGGPDGTVALACASGMAALHAALLATEVGPGERIVASRDLYGATTGLLKGLFLPRGIDVTFVDAGDLAATERALAGGGGPARVLLIETLSNPLLHVGDLPGLADLAHAHGARLVVDATFTPPVLLRPLEWGADLVIHSTTKYLSGHGDVLGGAAIARPEFAPALRLVSRLAGGVPGPTEAWLTLRGLKTLPLRYERQCENAAAVARWLTAHPAVETVHYPGLPGDPHHDRAARLFSADAATEPFGAMVAFALRDGDRARVFRFLDRLELCLPATSLGDVYTLVSYPAMASHRELTPRERARLGIGDGLVRLSAGIEHIDDILTDLAQALDG